LANHQLFIIIIINAATADNYNSYLRVGAEMADFVIAFLLNYQVFENQIQILFHEEI